MASRLANCLSATVLLCLAQVCASADFVITARAEPARVTPGSSAGAAIIVEVRDSAGQPAADGTEVRFVTTLGQVTPNAQTVRGAARGTVTSSTAGTAEVTVLAGGQTAKVQVEFTRDAGIGEGTSGVVRIRGTYTAFSSERQVVVASDHARFEQGRLTIEADTMQYALGQGVLKAQDRVLVRGAGSKLEGQRLSYEVAQAQGVLLRAGDTVEKAFFRGASLQIYSTEGPLTPQLFSLQDLSDTKTWVVADSITVFPNERIQFVSPQIYYRGVKLIGMPYYEMRLGTWRAQEGFLNQVFSFTSAGGLNVDFPVYYAATQAHTGALRIRRFGRGSWGSGYAGEGWSFGLEEQYRLGDGQGTLSLDNLLENTRGFRLQHHQDFDPDSRADISFNHYRYDERFPGITSGTAYYYHRLGKMDLNLTSRGSKSSYSTDWALEGNLRLARRARGGLQYDIVSEVGYGNSLPGSFLTSQEGRPTRIGLGTGLYLYPPGRRLDDKTDLTPSLSVSTYHLLGAGSQQSLDARLGLRRTLGAASSASLTYSYSLQRGASFMSGGRQRLDLSAYAAGGVKWQTNLYASYDLSSKGVFGSVAASYVPPFERAANGQGKWRVDTTFGYSRFTSISTKDSRISISRDIGNYLASLVYSPTGAASYSSYWGGFGSNLGRKIWIELNLKNVGF